MPKKEKTELTINPNDFLNDSGSLIPAIANNKPVIPIIGDSSINKSAIPMLTAGDGYMVIINIPNANNPKMLKEQ